MTIRGILGAIMSLIGGAGALVGLIFFIGSRGKTQHFLTGGILSAVGLLLLVPGIRIFLRELRVTPDRVRERLLRLAGKNHGSFSHAALTGEFGRYAELAIQQINDLVRKGAATITGDGDGRKYGFPEFRMELIMKQCPYCGNDYPVRDDTERCPACGGDLKIGKQRVAGKEGSYSMDE